MADKPGITVPGTVVTVEDKVSNSASPLPFYMFEVHVAQEANGKPQRYALATPGQFGGIEPQIALRLPPSSLRISSPIRADISLDLLGDITVAQGGMGLRRWTISGTHGVGMSPKLLAKSQNGEITMSEGYAVRQALATFFETWVNLNDDRRKRGMPMLRMLFAVRGGTLTEFQNEEWWIQPDGLPEEMRSIARPLAWDWSLSFVALRRLRDELSNSEGAETLMPPSSRAVLDAVDKASTAADKVIEKAQQSRLLGILAKAQDIKKNLQSVRDRVSAAVSIYRNTVSDISGYIRTCSRLVQETLLLVDRSNLYDQPSRELFNSLREIQTALGFAKMLADGYLEPFSANRIQPVTTTLQPGDTIQAIAARELGDVSRWKDLVTLNGLTYPYFDFSGPNGTPDSQFLGTGKKVLGQGDSLSLPNAVGNIVPNDPVGTDLTDAGTKGTLVAGVDNLRAALLRRLRTPRGYMPHHLEYGSDLPIFVGRPLTPALVLSIRAEVDRVLREDPRVVSVQSIGISVENDAIRIEASATSALGPVSLSGTVGALAPV